MNVYIEKSHPCGEIYAPPSKSMAHRNLICAALSEGKSTISNIDFSEKTIELAKKYEIPLFKTSSRTSEFLASLIASLKVSLAPRITRHGVLVEVYGEGMLILGDSGVGAAGHSRGGVVGLALIAAGAGDQNTQRQNRSQKRAENAFCHGKIPLSEILRIRRVL